MRPSTSWRTRPKPGSSFGRLTRKLIAIDSAFSSPWRVPAWLLALLLVGCASQPVQNARSPAQVRSDLLRLIPASADDRADWATDIQVAFSARQIAPSAKEAADGAKKTADAATELQAPVQELATGLGSAAEGIGQVKASVTEAVTGVTKVVKAVNDLQTEMARLKSALDQLQKAA